MSRRRKLAILFSLLLAVILLILWWLFRAQGPGPAAQPVVTPSAQEPIAPGSPESQTPEVAARVQSSGAQTVAKVFVERYGSFSNEAQFANIRDVIALATPSYAATLQAQADAGVPSAEYYGVTTRVISLTTEAMDDVAGTARFTVNAQRTEAKGSAQNVTTKYQEIEVSLEKVGTDWKISGAAWK